MLLYIFLIIILYIFYKSFDVERFKQDTDLDELRKIYVKILNSYMLGLENGDNKSFYNNVDVQIVSFKTKLAINFKKENLNVLKRSPDEFSTIKIISSSKNNKVNFVNFKNFSLNEKNNKLLMLIKKDIDEFELINLEPVYEENIDINKFIFNCKIRHLKSNKFLENSLFNQLILNHKNSKDEQKWKIIITVKI
jgi:hypothetical protein